MKQSLFKRLTGVVYAAILIILAVMFFTNDFGLVDLRKTSIIIGVGIDYTDDGTLSMTAQLAVPRPAENGENTQFSTVTGEGATVARALNDINVKTGYFPKLVFCKLILIGESAFDKDIVKELNYFFENEYTGLTPRIAACEGKAGDILSLNLPLGDSAVDSIERLLSDEAQKSANVSAVNLNDFGQGYYSESGASYMPYIQQDGEEESSGESEGESGQSGQEGSSQSGGESVQFGCGRTAIFSKGKCAGIFSREQAFAFNLLGGGIRRTYVGCGEGESVKTLSMRSCRGGVKLKIESGSPVLKISFSAKAKIQDRKAEAEGGDKRTDGEVLIEGEQALKQKLSDMFDYAQEAGCDIMGIKDLLYKTQHRYYAVMADGILNSVRVEYSVSLRSAG